MLCLHGFTQNADVFRKRTGAIRKALKSKVDFVFVDGPHSAAGAFPDAERRAFDAGEAEGEGGVGPRAWWLVGENAERASMPSEASGSSRATEPGEAEGRRDDGRGAVPVPAAGTWTRPALSRQMRGWDESAALIRDAVATHGPFDGVLAFSQGASTAALALALIPELAASVTFAVLVGGFEPMDPEMAAKLPGGGEDSNAARLAARSLHVHGANDAMVSRQRTEALMGAFVDPELFVHQGGHGIPAGGDFRARLKAFILDGE